MTRYEKKVNKLITFGRELADLSTCRRHTNAAIIFPPNCSAVYAIGYNGPPVRAPNDSCMSVPGACGCIHAEANALLKLTNQQLSVMFCTKSPCMQCAGLIINSQRIFYVIYDVEYRETCGIERLKLAGIACTMGVYYDKLHQ